MQEYNVKISELAKDGNMLDIALRIKGPYDPTVKEPKVTIVFSNSIETRRLPIMLQAYFPDSDIKTCNILAKYRYNFAYLFFNCDNYKEVELYFELTYGDITIERIPFTLSGDIKIDLQEDVYISEYSDSLIFNTQIETNKVGIISKIANFIRPISKGLWTFVLFLLFIPLAPFFIIESILALPNLTKRAPKNNKKGIMHIANHFRWRINNFLRINIGITSFKTRILFNASDICNYFKIKANRIVFISTRRRDLTGNFQFIYDLIKDDKNIKIKFLLDDRELKNMSIINIIKFAYYKATSKVILIDDYTPLIHRLARRKGTSLIQLWHACGAFKTFGYSRLGKPGGQTQTNPAHRNYDYAIVSSKEIAKHYAEGFGISLNKVIATGIPRTDIFFDDLYKDKTRREFFNRHPKLKDKKIILFAPTFRGNGKLSGHYPVDKFDVVKLYEELKGEYAIIIKHHPFVNDRNIIPSEYEDYIIDLSLESEINDLLFVTDLLITDYSSVIFEASLLDIPMIFFAYDLHRYIASRGFYYEYEKFVPGKIVSSFGQVIKSIKNKDFQAEKNLIFKNKFFDDLDGRSSKRTVDLIYDSLQLERDGEKQ